MTRDRVIESAEQLHQGALARSIESDHSRNLTRRHHKIKIIENQPVAVWIPERDTTKAQPFGQCAGTADWMLRLDDARLERKKFEEITEEQTVGIELSQLA